MKKAKVMPPDKSVVSKGSESNYLKTRTVKNKPTAYIDGRSNRNGYELHTSVSSPSVNIGGVKAKVSAESARYKEKYSQEEYKGKQRGANLTLTKEFKCGGSTKAKKFACGGSVKSKAKSNGKKSSSKKK